MIWTTITEVTMTVWKVMLPFTARLWNTISNYLRNIDTYHSFKCGLKELDLVGL